MFFFISISHVLLRAQKRNLNRFLTTSCRVKQLPDAGLLCDQEPCLSQVRLMPAQPMPGSALRLEFRTTHLGRWRQEMGGFRLKPRSASLKRVPCDGVSACGVKVTVAMVEKVNVASARHSSQELQLQDAPVSLAWSSSTDLPLLCWALIEQSSGMAAEVTRAFSLLKTGAAPSVELCVIATCCIAASIAMALPIQPRTGSKAIIKARSRNRIA